VIPGGGRGVTSFQPTVYGTKYVLNTWSRSIFQTPFSLT
jgi:hypothetical protein